ncbi:DUF6758 family protein [Nocardioides bruguierae]|uniref:Uncharacterized protein n=1 Tax=Nocardioides bruguierae TaxID=2945102 RepID=A0A9X2IDK0_9ACTN|nr:DUF6758 family protein [Nocardioides bruguierae]MCL8024939.1 hypothetical protein [Nocardioides bruguierae]MCM0619342.1 hypothetical protein [Nocardioides bruguierae]
MSDASCPRCPAPVGTTELDGETAHTCPTHGAVAPLWRADALDYAALVAQVDLSDEQASLVPWPLGPGWAVTALATAGSPRTVATLVGVSGTSAIDGPVDVLVVHERPGTGLGARCAGVPGEPGPEAFEAPPLVRLRAEHRQVNLWPVSTGSTDVDVLLDLPGVEPDDDGQDRSVLVGEVDGQWLWLVVRPASAVLMLREGWHLRDLTTLGPALVQIGFGETGQPW